MSLKVWLVIAVGLTVLTQEAAAASTCPGTLGPSSTPDSDFTVNTDGTVLHAPTGLMWKQCSEGLSGEACATGAASFMTWSAALNTAKASAFAGYTDWRLPNRQELESLVDVTCGFPTINETIFPGTRNAETWTSTTVRLYRTQAWFVNFSGGDSSRLDKTRNGVVRLVRGGGSFDSLASTVVPACSLTVSGDTGVTAGKDGVLLLRYLLGFRGDALIAGGLLGPGRADAQAVENFIGTGAQYDVFGRATAGATAMQDALVLLRLMLGLPDAALLTGISLPADATFTTGSAVRGNVNSRCTPSF